jgi:hypothetical protein
MSTGGQWRVVYTRCPRCRLCGPNSLPESGWNGEQPQWLVCAGCGMPRSVAPQERQPADAAAACPRCESEVGHPATANLARCPACGLLYRLRVDPRPMRMRHVLNRISFDGWTVTLTRLWCPVPRWRYRRTPLDRLAGIWFGWWLADGGPSWLAWFEVEPFDGPSQHVTLWTVGTREIRKHQFAALATTINEAVASRVRLTIMHGVGLGPWSDPEWADIERRVPELRALADHPRQYRPQGHRTKVESELRRMRGETDPPVAGWPRPVPGLPSLDREPSGYSARFCWGASDTGTETWRVLIDRLAAGQDLTSCPDWRRSVATFLGYGQHWLAVRPYRLTRR